MIYLIDSMESLWSFGWLSIGFLLFYGCDPFWHLFLWKDSGRYMHSPNCLFQSSKSLYYIPQAYGKSFIFIIYI